MITYGTYNISILLSALKPHAWMEDRDLQAISIADIRLLKCVRKTYIKGSRNAGSRGNLRLPKQRAVFHGYSARGHNMLPDMEMWNSQLTVWHHGGWTGCPPHTDPARATIQRPAIAPAQRSCVMYRGGMRGGLGGLGGMGRGRRNNPIFLLLVADLAHRIYQLENKPPVCISLIAGGLHRRLGRMRACVCR